MIVFRSNKKHVARVWFEIVYGICLTKIAMCFMNFIVLSNIILVNLQKSVFTKYHAKLTL